MVCEFLWKKGYEKNLHQWLAADEVRCRRFATFIETGGRDGDAGDFGAVATEFHTEFWEQYDFYTGFHGCFVENPDDYRLRGIRAGNPDEIYRIAVEKFGREEKIRTVFEDLRETGYLEHNTGKVFAVQSIEYFKEDGGFCHAKGSELLGMVAKKIGLSSEDIYASGDPSIIEFVAFKKWLLEENAWQVLSRSVLLEGMARVFGFSWDRDFRHSGMVLDQSIPAQSLVKRYRCDQCGLPVELVEEYCECGG